MVAAGHLLHGDVPSRGGLDPQAAHRLPTAAAWARPRRFGNHPIATQEIWDPVVLIAVGETPRRFLHLPHAAARPADHRRVVVLRLGRVVRDAPTSEFDAKSLLGTITGLLEGSA